MAFTNYKSIADVLKSFPLNYQEKDFVQDIKSECDEYFISRLNTVIQEGIELVPLDPMSIRSKIYLHGWLNVSF